MKLLVLAICCIFFQLNHETAAQTYRDTNKTSTSIVNTVRLNLDTEFKNDYPNFNPSENSRPVIRTRSDNSHLYDARLEDVEILKKALDARRPDTRAIVNILGRRTNLERRDIAAIYDTLYKQPLEKVLKYKLWGWFRTLTVSLMMAPTQFYAKQLYDAMDHLHTEKDVLIEILSIFNNKELKRLRSAYERMYGHSLITDVKDATRGNFRTLMMTLATGVREENYMVDWERARIDARKLFEAGKMIIGTNEMVFISILTQNSPAQLLGIAKEYQVIAQHSLETAIYDEFSGSLRKALLAIMYTVKDMRTQYFARALHESMAGPGTNDWKLIRIITSRAEVDMKLIKKEYLTEYQMSLENAIIDDTSGDYKDLLLMIVRNS